MLETIKTLNKLYPIAINDIDCESIEYSEFMSKAEELIEIDEMDELSYILNEVNKLLMIETSNNHFYIKDNEHITITAYMVNNRYKYEVNVADVTKTFDYSFEASSYAISFL